MLSLDREAVKPGAYPSEHQFFLIVACLDNFLQHTPSNSGLAKPGGLQCDSSASTTSIVDTDVSATVRDPNNEVLGFEFLLSSFVSGGSATDNSGLW